MTKRELKEAGHIGEHLDNVRGALLRKDIKAADTHAAIAQGMVVTMLSKKRG